MDRSTVVHIGSQVVTSRLARLDLSEHLLLSVVAFGMRYVFECTSNDPPGTAGFLAWAKMNRALRDGLAPAGWSKNDSMNYPRTVHPSKSFSIAVVGGDANTGLENRVPTNRTEKGTATREVVSRNQMSFADVDPEFPAPDKAVVPDMTWLLLNYRDPATDAVRAELSLPSSMDADGFVREWAERIILSCDALSIPEFLRRPAESPSAEVQITRRGEPRGV